MSNEEACCAAVRRFQSKRAGEVIEVVGRPERTERNRKAVEQCGRLKTVATPSSRGSRLVALRAWDSTDGHERRGERIRRALEAKIPKLLNDAKASDSESVLVLESDDIALSNVFEVAAAFQAACEGLVDLPDLVFLAETDAGVPHVWILKDGADMLPHEAHYENHEGV